MLSFKFRIKSTKFLSLVLNLFLAKMLPHCSLQVPQIAIVMTDGRSDYPKKTAAEALISQSAPFNITMIAVGIGKKVRILDYVLVYFWV